MAEKIKIVQFNKLDDVQDTYQAWRRALHLNEFETREDFFQGFLRELKELDEEILNVNKNRLNIAGEAADILLYAVGILDEENGKFSSILGNGDTVEFFDQLQRITKKRITENGWSSSKQVVDKIHRDTDAIKSTISQPEIDIKPKLKEIVLDASSLITLLGLPIGKIVSGKLARNEVKYKRELFEESVLNEHFAPLGIVGQALPDLVALRQKELKEQWKGKGKSLDAKYLKAALGPMAGLYLFGSAALHRVGKMVGRK